MKKNIFNIIVSMLVFTIAVSAQQTEIRAEAVIRADGMKEMRITDATGKVTTITASDNATLQAKYFEAIQQKSVVAKPVSGNQAKPSIVSHRAVLSKDGIPQIILTDAAGKETVITAAKGETVEQTYWAYLKKEGLACGCSPEVTPPVVEQKTAVRNSNQ